MDSPAAEQSQRALEEVLRDLPRVGTLVKDRGYRQVWRFELEGKAYFLKFYPRGGGRDAWRRCFRGSPARLEFDRLQALQRANVPAPRAVAMLLGLRLADRKGDAVILNAIEPSVQLDHYLNDLTLRGERIPNHLKLAEQVRSIVYALGRAKLGHEDLHLGNFLLHEGKLFLLDAYAVRRGGMRMAHLMQLGHSVSRFATKTDILRGWNQLGPGGPPPRTNPVARRWFDGYRRRATGVAPYFGRITVGEWSGVFFRQTKYPRRWSTASRLLIEDKDWKQAWPDLLRRMEADQFEILKRTRSGDVLAGEIVLGGRPLAVVIKRPRRRYWWRYVNEVWRGTRARRAWFKSWDLVARNLPTAWPLLLMERRVAGYPLEALTVYEQVPGRTLFHADLDALVPRARDMLLRRAGRLLRRIDDSGFMHADGKATNFIVREDEQLGPGPVLVDVDGIRRYRAPAMGIRRLLRSMEQHPQYTVPDSLALCQGYAPYSRMRREGEPDQGDDAHAEVRRPLSDSIGGGESTGEDERDDDAPNAPNAPRSGGGRAAAPTRTP